MRPVELDLFGGLPPATHRHDPQTSREAERRVTASGKRQTDLQRVVAYVLSNPGKTASEVAAALHPLRQGAEETETLYAVRRRLSDAAHSEPPLLAQGDPKGREVTWYAAADQGRLFSPECMASHRVELKRSLRQAGHVLPNNTPTATLESLGALQRRAGRRLDLLALVYEVVCRKESWQRGPTEGEVMSWVLDELANHRLDPALQHGAYRAAVERAAGGPVQVEEVFP